MANSSSRQTPVRTQPDSTQHRPDKDSKPKSKDDGSCGCGDQAENKTNPDAVKKNPTDPGSHTHTRSEVAPDSEFEGSQPGRQSNSDVDAPEGGQTDGSSGNKASSQDPSTRRDRSDAASNKGRPGDKR
ncbi:MAG: hypothetical protein AB7G11_07430 [Phycisphaerales bacterium]